MIIKSSANRLLLLSLVMAAALHIAVFAIEFNLAPIELEPSSYISVALLKPSVLKESQQIEDQAPKVDDVIKKELEPLEEVVSETTLKDNVIEPIVASDVLTKTADEKEVADTKNIIPTVNSKEFRDFIRSETERLITNDLDASAEFSDTFVSPTIKTKPDLENSDLPSLGGGIYLTRKNGVECLRTKVVPVRFDDFVDGTVTHSRCSKIKKKSSLLDENGKIKNSYRDGW